MTKKENAPASSEAKGAMCLLGRDIGANTTSDPCVQFLKRKGLPMNRTNVSEEGL